MKFFILTGFNFNSTSITPGLSIFGTKVEVEFCLYMQHSRTGIENWNSNLDFDDIRTML